MHQNCASLQGIANKRVRVWRWKTHRQECLCYSGSKSAGKMPAVRKQCVRTSSSYYGAGVTVRGKGEIGGDHNEL